MILSACVKHAGMMHFLHMYFLSTLEFLYLMLRIKFTWLITDLLFLVIPDFSSLHLQLFLVYFQFTWLLHADLIIPCLFPIGTFSFFSRNLHDMRLLSYSLFCFYWICSSFFFCILTELTVTVITCTEVQNPILLSASAYYV